MKTYVSSIELMWKHPEQDWELRRGKKRSVQERESQASYSGRNFGFVDRSDQTTQPVAQPRCCATRP